MDAATSSANALLRRALEGAAVESFGLAHQIPYLEFRDDEPADHVLSIQTTVTSNMENFLAQADTIRTQGVVQYPYAEDHDIPFISVADIAAVAAHYLLHPQWARQWTRNLMGPANLTLPACTALLAQAWGQSVRYQRQSAIDLQQTLGQWGLTAYAQQEMTALFQALGDPNGAYATPRTAEAYTPTSFQKFIRAHLLPLLQASS